MAVNVYYVGGFHLFCLLFFCTMKTMSKKNGVGGGAGVLVWFFFLLCLGRLKDCPKELHGCGIGSEVPVWIKAWKPKNSLFFSEMTGA